MLYKIINTNKNKCITCNKKIELTAKQHNMDRCWECIDTEYIKDLEEYKISEYNKIQKILDDFYLEELNLAYFDYQNYLKSENQIGLDWLNRDTVWKEEDDDDILQFDYEWNTFNWSN
jgi:hypothetical protein